MSKHKKIISMDFDGVIHSYSSGWQGVDKIPDLPVPGAIDFMIQLIKEGFEVHVFSSRSESSDGRVAMYDYIKKWAEIHHDERVATALVEELKFPMDKPKAHLSIDDRGFMFQGMFPSIEFIKQFKPWNKRG